MNKLGLIAGGGHFPGLVIAACRAQGRPLHVIALKGHAEAEVIGDYPADWIRLGEAGTGFSLLKKAGVTDVVMIGHVRRPSFTEMAPDFRTAAFMARVGMKALGDDGMLRAVVAELESEGFKVLGIDDVLSDCIGLPGNLTKTAPDTQAQSDIQRGVDVALALGRLDVGQAVVVQQGLVLGVEAVEGTDHLIRRTADLKRSGPGGVLVKLKKPSQDRRMDLPTIGVNTVREAAASGLRGIVFQAGGTLLLGQDACIAEADHLGLFLHGLSLEST